MKALGVAVFVSSVTLGLAWTVGGAVLAGVAAFCLLVQWSAFPIAYGLRTESFYDLTGSLTFLGSLVLCVAWAGDVSARSLVMLVAVGAWTTRLGFFLARRTHRAGGDSRFDEMKHSASRFFLAWTLQGVWVFLTALPAWVVLLRPQSGFGPLEALGLAVFAVGWSLEIVADRQKSAFRARPKNTGRFIDTGLWSWSRHPNYFGEMVLWVGIFVTASGQLAGPEWLAMVSPVFVIVLIGRVSGVPLLEAQAERRWGEEAEYRAYRDRTSVLVPWPPRAG